MHHQHPNTPTSHAGRFSPWITLNHRLVGFAFPIMMLAACSTGGQKITRSGFLPDYSQLQKVKPHKDARIWVSPEYRPDRYQEIVIEPVEWHVPHRSDKVEQMLKTAFRERLEARFSNQFRIVDGSAVTPATLRVRSAITGMRRTRWYFNAAIQAAQFATGGIAPFAPLQGGASEEFQVEDAQSGVPLIRLATFRNGKPWNVKGSYIAYDHARLAFKKGADVLAKVITAPGVAVTGGGETVGTP